MLSPPPTVPHPQIQRSCMPFRHSAGEGQVGGGTGNVEVIQSFPVCYNIPPQQRSHHNVEDMKLRFCGGILLWGLHVVTVVFPHILYRTDPETAVPLAHTSGVAVSEVGPYKIMRKNNRNWCLDDDWMSAHAFGIHLYGGALIRHRPASVSLSCALISLVSINLNTQRLYGAKQSLCVFRDGNREIGHRRGWILNSFLVCLFSS